MTAEIYLRKLRSSRFGREDWARKGVGWDQRQAFVRWRGSFGHGSAETICGKLSSEQKVGSSAVDVEGDIAEQVLKRPAGGEVNANTAGGVANTGADFEELSTQGFNLCGAPGQRQLQTEKVDQVVSGGVQEQAEGVGQKAVTAQAVGAKAVFELLDAILALSAIVVESEDFRGRSVAVSGQETQVGSGDGMFGLVTDAALALTGTTGRAERMLSKHRNKGGAAPHESRARVAISPSSTPDRAVRLTFHNWNTIGVMDVFLAYPGGSLWVRWCHVRTLRIGL